MTVYWPIRPLIICPSFIIITFSLFLRVQRNKRLSRGEWGHGRSGGEEHNDMLEIYYVSLPP